MMSVSESSCSVHSSCNTHHLHCVDIRDECDRSPLHLACEEGHKDVVEYLVEKANCDISE